MHGSREPVTFMLQTALALAEKHRVKVGFELPALDRNTSKSSTTGNGFSSDLSDGRPSDAWLKAFTELKKTKNADVFFFDVVPNDPRDRDSVMFLNLLAQRHKDSTAIIITIGGNVHNRLQPYKDQKTMAWYLDRYTGEKLLCVNHRYDHGSMYNARGDSTTLHEVKDAGGVLLGLSPTPDYFYLDTHLDFSKAWNAFLFTTKINPAFPVKNK